MQTFLGRLAVPLGAILSAIYLTSPLALGLGIVIAFSIGNGWRPRTLVLGRQILTISIILMGSGIDLFALWEQGRVGVGVTSIGIVLTLALGYLLAQWLKVNRLTGQLISVGTAICGGSAIAAMAKAMNADEEEVSVALAIVFSLNALALWIFPWVGHRFGLSPVQFGYWSALAIHDTSSVVGAALQFGPEAARLATTVKLTRALWIIPVTFAVSLLHHRSHSRGNGALYFMLGGFLTVAALFHFFAFLSPYAAGTGFLAHRMLVLALFFVGVNIDPRIFRTVGPRPFLMGVGLWVVVAGLSLAWVKTVYE